MSPTRADPVVAAVSAVPHSLNAPQRAAVLHVDGPCLVLAGAGSGKTRVITHKVAHLVSSGLYEARQIAALTFTNKAATEMKQRVGTLLDAKASRGLTVSTFHALGLQILRQEAEAIGLRRRFSILSADDARGILQDLCASSDPAIVKRLQTRVSLWKNAMLTPDEIERSDQADPDAVIAARVFRSYEATLKAYHAVDFDDLIGRAGRLVRRAPGRAVPLAIEAALPAHRRVAGHQRVPVPLAQAAGRRARGAHGGRRRRPGDLRAGAARRSTTSPTCNATIPTLHVIKLEQNYRSSGRILSAANA